MSAVIQRLDSVRYLAALSEATELEQGLISILYANEGHRMSVDWVMRNLLGIQSAIRVHLGVVYVRDGYVQFCCIRVRVQQILSRHGWQLNRSGGLVSDEIWISKQADSSVLN